MWRTIGSVVVGYMVMFVLVFTTFSLAYLMMGTDRTFQPGSYDVTGLWLVTSFVLATIAAIAGGFVCAAIAKDPRAPLWLAGLVLILGLIMAVPALMVSPATPPARETSVSNFEAMQNVKEPVWVALANPLIGAVGALVGAGLKRILADAP